MNNLIYESPDSGETVYVRTAGSTDRSLYSKSKNLIRHEVQAKKQQLWHDILLLAEQDLILKQELERVETLYFLINSSND